MKKATEFRRFKFDKDGLATNPEIAFQRDGKIIEYRILWAQHSLGYSTGYSFSTGVNWPEETIIDGEAVNKGASFPNENDALYDAAQKCEARLKELLTSRTLIIDDIFPLQEYINRLIGPERKPDDPVLDTKPEPLERSCRVCGCTELDCRQCIEKTGEACHWVEDDLCSACVEVKSDEAVPAAIITDEPQSPQNSNSMDFFQQLAAAGHVDFSFRILQKNGNLTINIKPGGTPQSLMPMNFTATPVEMDRIFFEKIVPAVKEVTELVTNIDDVKAQASTLPKDKPAASKKPASKGGVKKSVPKTKKGMATTKNPKAVAAVKKTETKKAAKPEIVQPSAFDSI